MRESIYHFKPVGHNTPDQKRNYPEPDPRLRKAFKEWFKEVEDVTIRDLDEQVIDFYNKALELTKDLEPNIPEAHSLLVAYQDHEKIEYAGLFLSAIYNRSPEKEIVFDLHLQNPPYGLGYKLRKGKRLINRGKAGIGLGYMALGAVINYDKAGDWLGYRAPGVVINYGKTGYGMGCGAPGVVINFGETGFGLGRGASEAVINYGKANNGMGYGTSGLVINYGEAGGWMGWKAPGVVINFGKAGHDMGRYASGLVINCGEANEEMGEWIEGIILALKDPISFGDISKAKLVLRAEDCKKIPELGEYLENLRRTLEVGKKDYQAVLAWLEGLGEEPKERIESDIEKILRRAGYIQF